MRFLRKVMGCLLVLAVFACGAGLYLLLRAPVFEKGKDYTFYTEANSSAKMVISQNPAANKLLLGAVAGESVRYRGDRYEELKERFRAELLFTEEVCGVKNYYLRSPFLGEGIDLYGKRFNLHIAVSAEETAAGTPLIFGGF